MRTVLPNAWQTHSGEPEDHTRADSALMIALALVPPLTWLAFVLSRSASVRPTVLEDDAYYYLGIARSIVEGGGSSFTGLLDTNGYHPLWMLVLLAVTSIFRLPNAILFALVAVQGLLWAWSVFEMWRLGGLLRCRRASLAGVAVYGVLTALTGRIAFDGMESALVMPLLLTLVRLGLEAGGSTPVPDGNRSVTEVRAGLLGGPPLNRVSQEVRHDWQLGLLLALVCLARLDAVFVAIAIGVVLLFRDKFLVVPSGPAENSAMDSTATPVGPPVAGDRFWRYRRAVRLSALPAVALAGYMVVNWVLFHSAVPVSGRAKALASTGLNLEPLTKLVGAGTLVGRPLYFGAAVGVAVVLAWALGRQVNEVRPVLVFIGALSLGQIMLTGYLVVGTSYTTWPWYNYILPVLGGLATMVLGHLACNRWGAWGRQACLVAATGFAMVVVPVVFRPEAVPHEASLAAAEFVRAELDGDAILAMGDRAGMFGYLADRRLLHLEGLVGDDALLAALKNGELVDRMAGLGVDYYVNYGAPGVPLLVGDRSCHAFDEPMQNRGAKQQIVVCDDQLVYSADSSDGPFTIWRFDPKLSRG